MKHRIIVNALLSSAVALLALRFAPSSAYAFTYANFCCGDADAKDDGPILEQRNACSIPNSGPVNDAYFSSLRHWGRTTTGFISSNSTRPATDCRITHGDSISETALVDRSVISNLNGLTTWHHANVCSCGGGGDYGETDTMVANNQDFSNPDGQNPISRNISAIGGGRATFIDEFGHQLGLGDQEGYDMMSITTSRPASGDVFSRAQAFDDDVRGVNGLYGFGPGTNLFTSAQEWNGSQIINSNSSQLLVCQSGRIDTRINVINTSLSSKTFHTTIYLALNPDVPPSQASVILFSGTANIFQHTHFTAVVSKTGPFTNSNAQLQGFFLLHAVDDDNRISENDENDNISTDGSVVIFGGC